MNWTNLLITFLPMIIIFAIFIGFMTKGKFFGKQTYGQMMDENTQRLDRIERHLASIADSVEQVAKALKALGSHQQDKDA